MEIICVPIIVAVVYGLIEVYKTIARANEKMLNFIPIIGLILGVTFGVLFYYFLPSLIVANNLFSAILVGAASGLSATGCNQIFKQLKKYGVTVKESAAEPNATSKTEINETKTKENNETGETNNN